MEDNYDRMNPNIEELLQRLDEFTKINYSTWAYNLSIKEAELLVKTILGPGVRTIGISE